MIIDAAVADVLEREGVSFCLVGAHALAVYGVARYTADVDLLTMDERVLSPAWWKALRPTIRRGDDEDPLAGLVRFATTPPVDLIVGKGPVMQRAVASATIDDAVGMRVVAPLELALLKLEAGSPRDVTDVLELLDAQRVLRPGSGLMADLRAAAPALSAWGQRAWRRLSVDLDEG